ncbi:cysteine hydrolase family protein [Roseovarius rhodophyticola]|uniref:Isochorismatase family protein n=1 Tax=Roseovarius rhodophyticola TaxID=3080827 RepID=A0ABZ2TGA0_9RHOB|nr:isochorismatase family protein [Roseovarius sp. W115]MDV2929034.1 isochorismatase family protein [Roseovarius sp. W115]
MFWSVVLFLSFCIAIWLWASARYMVRASEGVVIGTRPGAALLLVDLQEACWSDALYDGRVRARVEAAVAREVALAQRDDIPVIALRHEWSGIGTRLVAHLQNQARLIKGKPGTELAAPFANLADHTVLKRVEDGFETGELDALLQVLDVGHLRIMGRDGAHAVARTTQAALNRGYDVTLVADGIATAQPGGFQDVADALMSQGAEIRHG